MTENELPDAAIAVLKASHHGDQHFIACLKGDDAAELRAALVRLAEVLRGDCGDE